MALATVHRKVVQPAALSEVHDYEIRMDKIRSYLDKRREQGWSFTLKYYELAALFVMPLDVFMAASSSQLYDACIHMPTIVRHCEFFFSCLFISDGLFFADSVNMNSLKALSGQR